MFPDRSRPHTPRIIATTPLSFRGRCDLIQFPCQPTHQGTSVTSQPRCTIRALPIPQVPRSRRNVADSSLEQKHSVSSRGNVADSSRVHHCSRSNSMLSSVVSSVCSSVFSCRMKSKDRNPATYPSDKGGGELSSCGDKIPNISSLGNSFKGF